MRRLLNSIIHIEQPSCVGVFSQILTCFRRAIFTFVPLSYPNFSEFVVLFISYLLRENLPPGFSGGLYNSSGV